MGKKKREKWIKFRHRVVRWVLKPILGLFTIIKYRIHVEPFREQGNRQYLVLMNHQTPFDQFFVELAFRGPMYFVATEDIFSNGFISSVIRWVAAPIPIKKQAGDFSAVMNCLRVAREGGTIAMAPEGNRTYSGKTEYINPAIAGLAKKMKLPIVLFRIEGGYGKQPRWSDVVRGGRMRAYVGRVIEPEEYAGVTNETLCQWIRDGLHVDEGVEDGLYPSGKAAEYLERAVYVCPYCGLAEFESHGCQVECKSCGRKIIYGADKSLTGVGFDFPFRFFTQWYDYQQEFVNGLDLLQLKQEPVFRDRAKLSEVFLNRRKQLLREDAAIWLYGDRITVDEGQDNQSCFPFDEITAMAVLGRNKLNIYHDNRVFQFKGSKRFNALKYVNFYYRHKNIIRGNIDGKFLGL